MKQLEPTPRWYINPATLAARGNPEGVIEFHVQTGVDLRRLDVGE
jgi:hypothetical protein